MSVFKLHTLKGKLWAVVAASFVARVIMFFALPNTPSFLAPDEYTYAFLTRWTGESKPAYEFPVYGERLYVSGRALILPASLLYRVGFDELDAVRLVASAYGFCGLLLVVCIILKLQTQYAFKDTSYTYNEKLIAGVVLLFAFLPSHFVWSNLGLRESATEFWLITSFSLCFLILHYKKNKTAPRLLTLVGSVVLTFSARPQVGWVLSVALIAYLTLRPRKKYSYILIPIVLAAALVGSAMNLAGSEPTPKNLVSPLLHAGETIEYKQNANQFGAASVINPPSCPIETAALESSSSTVFDTYFCIAWRAPYMVSTFLFRPILGADVTSISSLLAALENLVWLAFFVTIFGLLIQRRAIFFLEPLLPAITFLFLYVLGASAYQGNMGTGFRHKSLILWAVLLVIFALAWRKPKEPPGTPGNNSQESAV